MLLFDRTDVVVEGAGDPVGVVAGQFFGGAAIDFAVAHRGSSEVTLHEIDGDTVSMAAEVASVVAGTIALASGDLDGDGDDDIVVIHREGAGSIDVLWGDPSRPFMATESIDLDLAPAWSVEVSDFAEDADCRAEIVVASGGTDGTLALISAASPGTAAVQSVIPGIGSSPWDVRAVELDGDRTAEIAVVDTDDENAIAGDDPVRLFEVADDTLSAQGELTGFENPSAVLIDDVTNDGYYDIVVAERVVDDVPGDSTQPGRLTVCTGGEMGGFTCETGQPTMVGPVAIVSGDFDCNGVIDVVVAGSGNADPPSGEPIDGAVWIYYGPGPEFVEVAEIASPIAAGSRMAVADFTGDGRPDIAIPERGAQGSTTSTIAVLSPRAD